MSQRVSHSLLDPWVGPPIKRLYPRLRIPRRFPPEGIVLLGHLCAIGAAIGFTYSLTTVAGGMVIALGVLGNHICDSIDGTHARMTKQCRNGGELLDHFTDPLSFAYWLVGWCVSIDRLEWGLAAVIVLYATAVLTNIRAKMLGEFTLATFGPTEFKFLLIAYGLAIAALTAFGPLEWRQAVSRTLFLIMLGVGLIQLIWDLVVSIRDVNQRGAKPDTSDWVNTRAE